MVRKTCEGKAIKLTEIFFVVVLIVATVGAVVFGSPDSASLALIILVIGACVLALEDIYVQESKQAEESPQKRGG